MYIVKQGDNLLSIARKSWAAIQNMWSWFAQINWKAPLFIPAKC